jgi:hypothetical protein
MRANKSVSSLVTNLSVGFRVMLSSNDAQIILVIFRQRTTTENALIVLLLANTKGNDYYLHCSLC